MPLKDLTMFITVHERSEVHEAFEEVIWGKSAEDDEYLHGANY